MEVKKSCGEGCREYFQDIENGLEPSCKNGSDIMLMEVMDLVLDRGRMQIKTCFDIPERVDTGVEGQNKAQVLSVALGLYDLRGCCGSSWLSALNKPVYSFRRINRRKRRLKISAAFSSPF